MKEKIFCLRCENGHTWLTRGKWEHYMPSAHFDEDTCRDCGSGIVTLMYESDIPAALEFIG